MFRTTLQYLRIPNFKAVIETAGPVEKAVENVHNSFNKLEKRKIHQILYRMKFVEFITF